MVSYISLNIQPFFFAAVMLQVGISDREFDKKVNVLPLSSSLSDRSSYKIFLLIIILGLCLKMWRYLPIV